MEISALLTILLIVISLGGLFLRAGKLCLMIEEETELLKIIQYDLISCLYRWAVKLVRRDFYLLNIINTYLAIKTTQTTLIQLQNLKFEG
ncbi:hypothetical protein [Falsiporphyromonas endometrii]|uniref:Uncharacterized protein n=1 Tax=Falsiporphyromonas endometrii TaxID=1387297 RepID=A0ABV9K8G3_9PORP